MGQGMSPLPLCRVRLTQCVHCMQTKINGVRMELSEIDAVLVTAPGGSTRQPLAAACLLLAIQLRLCRCAAVLPCCAAVLPCPCP